MIPGSGRSPGGGHGNPLQYSCLEDPHGQGSLAGYSPWDCIESDTTEATWHACSGWRQLCDRQGQSSKDAGLLSVVADRVEALCSLLVSVFLVSHSGECPLPIFKFTILLFQSGQCPLPHIIFTLGVISLLGAQHGSSPEPRSSLPWADAGSPASTNAPISSHSPHRNQRSFLFFFKPNVNSSNVSLCF